jgi:nitroimidazol reductase NimA-like FMN-containing flavoprotein (pyridoxamine 5'-phosphate oxidase superfamily)
MAIKLKGPWSLDEIDVFLSQANLPLRLACVGSDGFPRVVSLWYQYQGGTLYCVTHQDSKLVALLQADDKVGFEVAPNEPPYHGVRGQGRVALAPLESSSTLEDLLKRYLGSVESNLANWLLSRSDEELLITISPHRLFSWDYRERMGDS